MFNLSVKSADPELIARLKLDVQKLLFAYEKNSSDAHDKRGATLALQSISISRESNAGR